MSGRRVAAIVRRVVAEIRRDRPSLGLLFIAPLLVTGLVTVVLREGQSPNVSVAIVADGGSAGGVIGGLVASSLRRQGATVDLVPDMAAARARVADGRDSVAVEIPPPSSVGGSRQIVVLTNGLDPSAESGQLATLQRALVGALAEATGASMPTIDHVTLYGTPSTDPMATFAPALVGFFIYFFVYLLTGVSFLRERTGGTLERLMATPVRRAEIVAGYTIGFGIFAVVQVALLMTWVLGSVAVPSIGPVPAFSVGLGVEVAGSPAVAFVVVLVLALGAVSLGILLSAVARTELQIIQFIPIVIVPQFLLSGVIFPFANLPAVIQPLAPFLPLTYAVDALRRVFVAGAGFDTTALDGDLLVLAGFAAAFATIAARTIRRDVA